MNKKSYKINKQKLDQSLIQAAMETDVKNVAAAKGATGKIMAGIPGAASDAASAFFQAEAQKEVARQQAEAQKEVARQAVHQAAVKVNPAMLHELDAPILQIQGEMGPKNNRAPYALSVSILGMFALGSLAEDAIADWYQLEKNITPSNFSTRFDRNRTPLTEVKGVTQVAPTTYGTQLMTATTSQHDLDIAYCNQQLQALQFMKTIPGLQPTFIGLRDRILASRGVALSEVNQSYI